jgi:hypothetical protein
VDSPKSTENSAEKQSHLKTQTADDTEKYKLNWKTYVEKMGNLRLPMKAYYYRPKKRREVGRSVKIGSDKFCSIQLAQELSFFNTNTLAQS